MSARGATVITRVAHTTGKSGRKTILHLEQAGPGASLESLGLHGEALDALHRTLARRRGLVAVSGARSLPAGGQGSGKSTFLKALQTSIESPHLSVVEAGEAPFLRAALKADPDVVVADDVRTLEAAALVRSAAARGMLVLASTSELEPLPRAEVSCKTRARS